MADPQLRKPWHIGVGIAAVVVLLFIGYGFAVPHFLRSWEKSNQFGGMFGGIGALFSGLALSGVVAAIWLQKQALEVQREDLKATLDELKRSAKAQEKQVKLSLITAQINALNTLAAAATADIERYAGSLREDDARERRNRYTTRIAKIMNDAVVEDIITDLVEGEG